MLYLTQALFLPWLLAAMLWGIAVGWRASGRMPRSPGLSWFAIWLGIFTFGMLLAGALALPGRWGLWLDTALHFLFWYIVGCALGSLLSYVGTLEGASEPVAAWARPIRTDGGPEPQPWTMPGWIRPASSAASGPVPALQEARAWLDVLRRGGGDAGSTVPAWMKPIAPGGDRSPSSGDGSAGRWPPAQIQEPQMAAWVKPTPQPVVTSTSVAPASPAPYADPRSRWPSDVGKSSEVAGWAKPVMDAAPAAPAPAAPAPATPAPAPASSARKKAAAPAPAAAPPAPAKAAGPDDAHDGERPPGLKAPRTAKADDLKRIRGIGRQNEAKLNGLGIFHFDQVASWTTQHALWVGSYLAFPGRIEREDWIGQAKLLAAGKDTEFSKRVDKGQVASSKG